MVERFLGEFFLRIGRVLSYTLDKDKNHEKHLAAFEAQGHAAGLKGEPATLSARARL